MNPRILAGCAFVLCASAFLAQPAVPQTGGTDPRFSPPLPASESTLPNGLRVVLAPDPTLPNVAVYVRYAVGSRHEPEGLSGLAHLVEHLNFARSVHLPPNSVLKLLTEIGCADLNGQTSADKTVYYETVLPERLEFALWLEAEKMGYFVPAIDQAALDQERAVVLNERRQRYLDVPGGIADLEILPAIYPSWHPYSTSTIGSEEDLERITVQDVKAFARTYYVPHNATLILAGRFEKETATALVEKYFATLPSRPPPVAPDLPELKLKGTTRVDIEAGVADQAVRLVWVTPRLGTQEDSALDYAAAVLGGGKVSRLQKKLVGNAWARHVYAWQSSSLLTSRFIVEIRAAKDVKAESLIPLVDEEIRDLSTVSPIAHEMERFRSISHTSRMFNLETAMGRAERLSEVIALGPLKVPVDWADESKNRVTSEDVRATVSKYLAPHLRAAVVVTRFDKDAPTGGVLVGRY